MGRVRTFRDLVAWQRAFSLGIEAYRRTAVFPVEERFGLTAQIRRSAVSIASNIAEGHGRSSRTDYIRFLKVARGSLNELDTQFEFARELGFLPADDWDPLRDRLAETERVLAGLIRALERTKSS